MSKPYRRSIRLKEWDYGSIATYFVTICTYRRVHWFEDAVLHDIAANAWAAIPSHPHAQHVVLDEWVVMPNHLHGILHFVEQAKPSSSTTIKPQQLGVVIGNVKMLIAKRVTAVKRKQGQKVWQRGYWERIIRNERELNATRRYIQENPLKWKEDADNLDRLLIKLTHNNG